MSSLSTSMIPVKIVKDEYNPRAPTMMIYVGKKLIAHLQRINGVLPDTRPHWWLMLPGGDIEAAGATEDEAILYAMTKYGYM